jgi:hypothetical protein
VTLCVQCSKAVAEGSRQIDSNPELTVVSTGAGVIGGRAIQTTIFRCTLCHAMWQREVDTSTLKDLWYLKAGI